MGQTKKCCLEQVVFFCVSHWLLLNPFRGTRLSHAEIQNSISSNKKEISNNPNWFTAPSRHQLFISPGRRLIPRTYDVRTAQQIPNPFGTPAIVGFLVPGNTPGCSRAGASPSGGEGTLGHGVHPGGRTMPRTHPRTSSAWGRGCTQRRRCSTLFARIPAGGAVSYGCQR